MITIGTGAVTGAAVDICSIKTLPSEKWADAARKAVEIEPANAPSKSILSRVLPHAQALGPQYIAVLTKKYWGRAGVRLTVGFMDNPAADLRKRILSHMNAWGNYAYVEFVETASDAQVRIARTPGSGYWSYLGVDILSISANEPTMNLDSFTMNTIDSEFYRVVRHETGHTLGFPHEHMRSEIVDKIDREKAIAYFMATQGWSRDEVIAQVLTPLDNSALIETNAADPQSIMCYWLPASIMKDNVAISGGTDIDATDAEFTTSIYGREASKRAPSLTAAGNGLWVGFVADNPSNQLLVCASEDGRKWTGHALVHGESSKTAPSLALFDNRLHAAFVADNSSNNVLVCSSADGQTWSANTAISGQSSKTAPSLAVFKDRLWIAFVANNSSNNVLVCSSSDGQNWTGNTVVSGQSSKTAPSLAVFKDRLWVAFIANNSSNNVLVCSSADGQNWTGNTIVGGQSSKTAPSLAVFKDRLWVAFIANNSSNNVLVCSSADGQNWSGNIAVNGESSQAAPSLAVLNDLLCVGFIANNSSNNVLICSSADGQNWSANVPVQNRTFACRSSLREVEQRRRQLRSCSRMAKHSRVFRRCCSSDVKRLMRVRIAGTGPVSLEELEARYSAYMNAGAPEPIVQGTPEERKAVFQLVADRGDSQMRSLMGLYLQRLQGES